MKLEKIENSFKPTPNKKSSIAKKGIRPIITGNAIRNVGQKEKAMMPMPVIIAYLDKFPSDIGREDEEIPTADLIDITIRLEALRTQFSQLKGISQAIADYYDSVEDIPNKNKFIEIAGKKNNIML